MAVIGAGIGEENEQVLIRRGGAQELPSPAQGQTVPVPPGGEIVEDAPLAAAVAVVLQK